MNRIIAILAALAALTCIGVTPRAYAQVEFIPLGLLPDATLSDPLAVSPDGATVVGYVRLTGVGNRAFRWTADQSMALLGDPQAYPYAWYANDVSADGSVVVGDARTQPELFEAFRWEGGALRVLVHLPGGAPLSFAGAISADGSIIVGIANDGPGAAAAVRWIDGTIERLVPRGSTGEYTPGLATSMSADGSVVAGIGISPLGKEAFVWDRGELIRLGDLPGGKFESAAGGVSANGHVVVGKGWVGPSTTAPFRWTRQTGMVQLEQIVPGKSAGAYAVSEDGWRILGSGLNEQNRQHIFLWDPINRTRTLEHVIEEVYNHPLGGWRLDRAGDITPDGTVIVGSGINPQGVREAFLARIPPFCYADCDRSSGLGVLDIFDFLCFQSRFLEADILYADCDQNGVLDFFDFLCFQNEFLAGCP